MEEGNGRRVVVVDMEAGLEHLSRATARHVDALAAVIEPYFRALETGRRVVELAEELQISRIDVVANKVRNDADREAIASFCEGEGLQLAAEIPYDDSFLEAERAREAAIDHAPDAPGVTAIRDWGRRLLDR